MLPLDHHAQLLARPGPILPLAFSLLRPSTIMRFSLPRLSTQIPTLHRPSLPTFRSLLSSPTPQPVLLTGLIDHWPALTSWTIPNKLGKLREMAQGVLVPVEWARRGRGYLDEEDGERTGGKTTMLLETYLDAFVLDRIPWEEPGMEEELTFYMAQCDLIDKVSLGKHSGRGAQSRSLWPLLNSC